MANIFTSNYVVESDRYSDISNIRKRLQTLCNQFQDPEIKDDSTSLFFTYLLETTGILKSDKLLGDSVLSIEVLKVRRNKKCSQIIFDVESRNVNHNHLVLFFLEHCVEALGQVSLTYTVYQDDRKIQSYKDVPLPTLGKQIMSKKLDAWMMLLNFLDSDFMIEYSSEVQLECSNDKDYLIVTPNLFDTIINLYNDDSLTISFVGSPYENEEYRISFSYLPADSVPLYEFDDYFLVKGTTLYKVYEIIIYRFPEAIIGNKVEESVTKPERKRVRKKSGC